MSRGYCRRTSKHIWSNKTLCSAVDSFERIGVKKKCEILTRERFGFGWLCDCLTVTEMHAQWREKSRFKLSSLPPNPPSPSVQMLFLKLNTESRSFNIVRGWKDDVVMKCVWKMVHSSVHTPLMLFTSYWHTDFLWNIPYINNTSQVKLDYILYIQSGRVKSQFRKCKWTR